MAKVLHVNNKYVFGRRVLSEIRVPSFRKSQYFFLQVTSSLKILIVGT